PDCPASVLNFLLYLNAFAQEIPVQSPRSSTKSKGSVRLDCDLKGVYGDLRDITVHWYQQKPNDAPERILYHAGAKVVDGGFQAHRYTVEKFPSQKLCILTIKDITPDDAATYYCAYWYPAWPQAQEKQDMLGAS
uniref:Ig-like domain-containing protein n=1 Tax=Falco tinnunculus TaxID=100819 RepID=A0A8C4TZ37_FALTI